MILPALKFILVANWIVAGVLSYTAIESRSNEAPLQASATVTVTSWNGAENARQIYQELGQFSREHRITLAKSVADRNHRGSVRHLYLVSGVPGSPASDWLDRGIGDFSSGMRTKVHPLADIGDRAPIGEYEVFGSTASSTSLQGFFQTHGMETQTGSLDKIGPLPRFWNSSLFVVALLSAGIVGAYAVSNVRQYAIERLHGMSASEVLRRDARRYLPVWAVSGVVILGLAWALLRIQGASSGVPTFLLLCLGIQLLFLLAVVVAHAITLAMLASVDVLGSLKGEVPGAALAFAAYGVRVTAAFVALAAAIGTITLASGAAARAEARSTFDKLGDLSVVTLGGVYKPEDQRRLDTTVGRWIRGLDRSGQVIVAGQVMIGNENPRAKTGTGLVVNDQFLAEQDVRTARGETFRPSATPTVTLLVPSSRWSERKKLPATIGIGALVAKGERLNYEWVETRNDQRIFTYAQEPDAVGDIQIAPEGATYAEDPVIVHVPSRLGLLSESSYAAYASQSAVLFKDRAAVTSTLQSDADLDRYVLALTPAATVAAEKLAKQTSELRGSMLLLVLACLVVFMSGVAAAVVHTRRMSQRIFVKHVHGWRFTAIYKWVLAVEGTLLLTVVLWTPISVLNQRREFESLRAIGAVPPIDPPSLSGAQYLAIILLAALLAGGFLSSLRQANRQVMSRAVARR